VPTLLLAALLVISATCAAEDQKVTVEFWEVWGHISQFKEVLTPFSAVEADRYSVLENIPIMRDVRNSINNSMWRVGNYEITVQEALVNLEQELNSKLAEVLEN